MRKSFDGLVFINFVSDSVFLECQSFQAGVQSERLHQ